MMGEGVTRNMQSNLQGIKTVHSHILLDSYLHLLTMHGPMNIKALNCTHCKVMSKLETCLRIAYKNDSIMVHFKILDYLRKIKHKPGTSQI